VCGKYKTIRHSSTPSEESLIKQGKTLDPRRKNGLQKR
jgi:hypothetical protein